MGRIPNFRRLRARSAEEQMLATMLIAGLVFAVVSLVAFLRPGGSSSAAKGPRVTSQANANVSDGSGNALRTRTSHTSTSSGVIEGGQAPADLTQKLQGLFASVLSPLGFTTNLPRLEPLPSGSVPIQPASSGGGTNPTSFPSSFPALPGRLPPPVSLPPVTNTLPPTTDTLPPPTTVPPTTLPPTTLPPTTQPPTTQPPTTQPPTTQPPTTQPPSTDTTAPPSSDTTAPPSTDTLPPSTDTLPPSSDTSAPPPPPIT